MASNNNNNNNARNKKQKRTEREDSDDYSSDNSLPLSLSTPEVQVDPSALSFGTIVNVFPDFLSCVLPYIADRVVWNSIAGSNKDIHDKSKAILPPWPLYYEVPSHNCVAWSPCGTRIAYVVRRSSIAIIDQRVGPLRNNGHINARPGKTITDLKYSLNGRFLVSTGNDGFVRLWDSVTGNYALLQEWNIQEETAISSGYLKVSISACSKYIAVSSRTCVFFKDIENDGNTIKSFISSYENMFYIENVIFSSYDRAIFIGCKRDNDVFIKVWRPYLDDDDENLLITLTKKQDSGVQFPAYNTSKFSHDNSMIAVRDSLKNEGTVWSLNTDHKCLTKKFDFQGNAGLHFTPDGKYIVVNKYNGRPTLWSIAEGTYTNKTIHFVDIRYYTKHSNLIAGSLSPNNRQCIVQVRDPRRRNSYIISGVY